jgi:hypothetical protein
VSSRDEYRESGLMNELLTENVSVVTTLVNAVMTEDGQMAEIPHTVEGILIDYDVDFIMLADKNGVPELISRPHVVTIKVIDTMEEHMQDPARPKDDKLN